MKKVIIIDDEPLARNLVLEYLSAHAGMQVVAECNDGFEGVKSITQHKPDLVFLDIQMPKINGFEMLELLPEVPPTIFTTAFDEYAIKAFEANAIDYLLKPFSKERFDQALEKWKSKPGSSGAGIQEWMEASPVHQPEERNRIVVKAGNEIRILPAQDISYLEAYDDYVKIYSGERYFVKKKTMNYYEEVLDPMLFFRVHRSFILNISQLTKIESLEKNSYVAILKNGSRVPISRSNYGKLKEKLGI